MKRLLALTLGLAATLMLAAPLSAQEKAVDPTGKWEWTAEGRDGQTRTNALTLKLDGGKLAGTLMGRRQQEPTETPIESATLKGDTISFQVTREWNGNKMVSKYVGKISGDTMKLTWSVDRNGQTMTRDYEAKRQPAKP